MPCCISLYAKSTTWAAPITATVVPADKCFSIRSAHALSRSIVPKSSHSSSTLAGIASISSAGRCWALGTDLSGTSHRAPHAGPATPVPGYYTQGAWDAIEARVRAYFDNGGSADPFFPLGAGMIGLGRPAEELTPENIEEWKRDAVMRHIASKRGAMVFDETRLTKEDDLAFLPWAHVGERPRYERTAGESFSGWRRRELINWHTALRSARG